MIGATLSTPVAPSYVATGKDPTAVHPHHPVIFMNAQDAASRITESRRALKRKRLNANSSYHPEAWREALEKAGLLLRYPNLPISLALGFDAGVPPISITFIPLNCPSTSEHAVTFQKIIENKLHKGRYIGPLTQAETQALIGPFQTLPLSIIPKSGKSGKFRIIQNLSFPHSPDHGVHSINSTIDPDHFPCTWGTFAIVSLVIARLPPGSEAAVCDVKEAY